MYSTIGGFNIRNLLIISTQQMLLLLLLSVGLDEMLSITFIYSQAQTTRILVSYSKASKHRE